MFEFNTVEEAVEDLKKGKIINDRRKIKKQT